MSAGGGGASSYGGMALQAIGDTIQLIAAGKTQRAMGKAFQEAIDKQQGYRQEGANIFNTALGQWSPEQTQADMAAGKASRLGQYSQLAQTPMSFQSSMGGATADAAAQAQAAQAAEQQAQLGSYGDWLVGQTIKNMGTQRQLGQTSNFAAGTASLLPYQMYKAQHAYDLLQQIGAGISTIGSMGSRGPSGAMNTTAPPTGYGSGGANNQYFQPQNYGSVTPQWAQYGRDWANYYNNPQSPGYVQPGTFE